MTKHSRRATHPSIDRRIVRRRKSSEFYNGNEQRNHHDRRDGDSRRRSSDRRRYVRFPIMADLIKPVEFTIFPSKIKDTIPGIITQLAPGGMTLLSFAPIHQGTTLFLSINLPHLKIPMIEGIVMRVTQKGETYTAGINFKHIKPDDRASLNKMALDYADCELKLSFGITDVCFKDCGFLPLCEKPQKINS